MWVGRGQCIEHYGSGEAYLPLLDALGRLCRGAGGEHLIELLRKHAPMWLVQLPAFIESEELEALQRKVQGASRERMLRELAEALEVLTAEQPFILLLEDLHWSDVSTLDLLAVLARRKEPARLLVIGTYRPVEMLTQGHPLKNITQELYAHQLATELSLGVLSEADVEKYLVARFSFPSPFKGEGQGEGNEKVFSQNLAHLLHHRTEGNPLFLVSLVDDLVARGALVQTGEGWTLQSDTTAVGIPESIRQLVARQRNRLQPEEQRLLEAASVAGMEFSAATVAAALTVDTAAVEQRCEWLAERQHFLRRVGIEEWPDGTVAARYSFLHALYQQLWHERVTPMQLQQLHLQIGQRKERAYDEQAREIAAELATHFEQGRNYRRAVHYLQQAGENARQRSAYAEAIALLSKGLDFLKRLPNFPEHPQLEIALQTSLGDSLIATKGYAAPEVGQAYARALKLHRQLKETPQLLPVMLRLQRFYMIRAELHTAHELAEQCLHLAQKMRSPTHLIGPHTVCGLALFNLGEIALAQDHLEQGRVLHDPQKHHPVVSGTWQDYKTVCLSFAALALWSLGYPDQALKRSREALTLAQELSHPYSLAWTLGVAALLSFLCRDGQATQELAEATIRLSTEQGFMPWLAWGTILQGWALAEQGQREKGVVQMRRGLTAWRATGAELRRPYFLAMLAEAYGEMGQPEEGLEVLADATNFVDNTKERCYEAELYRLKGELTLEARG